MDRQVTQTGALIPNATLLGGEKAKLVALGYALQALLGNGTVVDGLAISATSPASLSVVIGTGSLMTYAAIDPSAAFGDLGTDTTHFTMKQGLLQEPGATLVITPPAAAGYSQVYLVQAAYQDQDSYTVLPYWNASNVLQPYNGPNNSGNADLTLRASKCVVALKPGTAAATGSQVAPTPDPGYTPLYLITVANGATQITSANIALYPGAPFLDLKLPQVRAAIQGQAANWAIDIGTANAAVVSLPAFTPSALGAGTPLRIKKIGSANTAAMTITVNGSQYPVVTRAGAPLVGGEWGANERRSFIFDGTSLCLEGSSASGSSGPSSVAPLAIFFTQKTTTQALDNGGDHPITFPVGSPPAAVSFDGQTVTFQRPCKARVIAEASYGVVINGPGYINNQLKLILNNASPQIDNGADQQTWNNAGTFKADCRIATAVLTFAQGNTLQLYANTAVNQNFDHSGVYGDTSNYTRWWIEFYELD